MNRWALHSGDPSAETQTFEAPGSPLSRVQNKTAMERSEERAMARKAMESLTASDRAAILMREDGLAYAEIAAQMGIELESVGATLARARKRLGDRFELLKRGAEAQRNAGT